MYTIVKYDCVIFLSIKMSKMVYFYESIMYLYFRCDYIKGCVNDSSEDIVTTETYIEGKKCFWISSAFVWQICIGVKHVFDISNSPFTSIHCRIKKYIAISKTQFEIDPSPMSE